MNLRVNHVRNVKNMGGGGGATKKPPKKNHPVVGHPVRRGEKWGNGLYTVVDG